jgi:hypothetical protein
MNDSLQKDLITALGIDTLPQAEQDEMMLRIGKLLVQGIMLRAFNILSDRDRDEVEKFVEANPNDIEALYGLLNQMIPDFSSVIQDEVTAFKADALDVMGGISS